MIDMEANEKKISNLNNSCLTLFGFVLNRSQTILFLILSVIGIFMLPLILSFEIFSKLFHEIFFAK
jgi:hypothetical protein